MINNESQMVLAEGILLIVYHGLEELKLCCLLCVGYSFPKGSEARLICSTGYTKQSFEAFGAQIVLGGLRLFTDAPCFVVKTILLVLLRKSCKLLGNEIVLDET